MGETTTEVREKGAGGRRPLALLCVEESLEVEEAVLWGAPPTRHHGESAACKGGAGGLEAGRTLDAVLKNSQDLLRIRGGT